VTDWNEDAFFDRASPELEKVVSARDGDRLFATFRKLGHVVQCDPAKGQAHMTAILGQPRTITASYEADARFEKGEAKILLDLIKHDDRWEILGFHINSAALIPK
jgi:hypothetical protein